MGNLFGGLTRPDSNRGVISGKRILDNVATRAEVATTPDVNVLEVVNIYSACCLR